MWVAPMMLRKPAASGNRNCKRDVELASIDELSLALTDADLAAIVASHIQRVGCAPERLIPSLLSTAQKSNVEPSSCALNCVMKRERRDWGASRRGGAHGKGNIDNMFGWRDMRAIDRRMSSNIFRLTRQRA